MADNQKELEDLYESGVTDRQMAAAKKRYAEDTKLMDKVSEPKGYSVSKKPEPTFKSDVDSIISGAKKIDKKIDDTVAAPIRKVMSKAAGKEEKGILNTKFSKDYKKGGSVSSASSRADGCAVKGKTKGRIV